MGDKACVSMQTPLTDTVIATVTPHLLQRNHSSMVGLTTNYNISHVSGIVYLRTKFHACFIKPAILSPICSTKYFVTDSTLTSVGPLQLPAPQSGTLSRILSGTRPSVQTVLETFALKRICSLDTSASSFEVLDDNCAL